MVKTAELNPNERDAAMSSASRAGATDLRAPLSLRHAVVSPLSVDDRTGGVARARRNEDHRDVPTDLLLGGS